MESKERQTMGSILRSKSAWAALATLGVTAVAAGATAFVKIREKRRQQEQEKAASEIEGRLTAEQMMVYNEAVTTFLSLNDRIYELRRHRELLQDTIGWMAGENRKPETESDEESIKQLQTDIERFMTQQKPFIEACLGTVGEDGMTYVDCVRGAVGGTFDPTLDEEPTGADIAEGAPIHYVLRLGYYFPDSTIAPHPVKSIVVA